MNKLFKLIYVNLLDLFDINKIIVAREDGVRSNLEKRTILVVLLHVLLFYFLYVILDKMAFSNHYYLLAIGYIAGTLYCFASNLSVVESMIFKSDDIDFLLSYPVSKNQILFSKLFTIYLKNMLIVFIMMGICLICYYLKVQDISDTLIIMYMLVGFTVPLIPIVLSSIITYINDYFKTKTHNNLLYKFVKTVLLCLFVVACILVFYNIGSKNAMEQVLLRTFKIYPLVYVFVDMLQKESVMLFVILLAIPILCCYLYTFVVSNNYLKICSLLKGVKTKNKFIYSKSINLGSLGGLVRKEFLCLFKNKPYFVGTFSVPIILTVVFCIVCNVVDVHGLKSDEIISLYFNLFSPMILSIFSSIGCSTISSMSLEKNNLQMLRTQPFSMGKILFAKCCVNILIGLIFVLVNGTMAWCYLDLNKWSVLFCYLIPFISLIFISLTGIVLDYKFIEKNENEDGAIINQRLITMVPILISLIIGIGPMFVPIYKQFALLLGAYVLVLVLGIIAELLYLLINKKKLIRNLF